MSSKDLISANAIEKVIESQREFFSSLQTRDVAFRIAMLKKLLFAVKSSEQELIAALESDLRRPEFESYMLEIGIIYEEIRFAIKNLKKWAKPQKVSSPMSLFYSQSQVRMQPRGVVLILSPWNYPVQLLLCPLVGAIAAGNCAILKPSELASKTAEVIAKMIRTHFSSNYICVLEGNAEFTATLLKQSFDMIFFTGSTAVGKKVMLAAAENLTPVVLELGGKSPCILNDDIDFSLAAKRIVWGKFLNAGQTCVAPDYILVSQQKKQELIENVVAQIKLQISDEAKKSEFACIINQRHFARLKNYLQCGTVVYGGEADEGLRQIAPTVMTDVGLDSQLMRDEIFGPILPIISYQSKDDLFSIVAQNPNPLALYVFTQSNTFSEEVIAKVAAGGVCINDTLIHLGNSNLPFGGVRSSGLGKYHGYYSFKTFSHEQAVLKKSWWPDFSLRYRPYKKHLNWLRWILR